MNQKKKLEIDLLKQNLQEEIEKMNKKKI